MLRVISMRARWSKLGRAAIPMAIPRPLPVFHTIRALHVSVEPTPNPDSLKFVPDEGRVLEEGQGSGVHFTSVTQAKGSAMVQELLRLPGITGVFLGPDFVSVNKQEEADWDDLRSMLLGTIMDHLGSGTPVFQGENLNSSDDVDYDDEDEIVAMIRELLDTRIRPAVQEDGGDIHYRGFDEETGIVKLQMAGSCVGCPSSTATLYNGVENMLMHYVPEVRGIEAVEEEGTEKKDPEANMSLEDKLRAAGVPN